MKHQVLQCPGPPPHTWEREAGRGRPPKTCPEHAPQKEHDANKSPGKPRDNKVAANPQNENSQVHVGERGGIGRPNPFIERAKNPFIERAKRQAEVKPSSDKLTGETVAESNKRRYPRPKPVDERTDEEKLLEESEEMDGIIERANRKYTEALQAAINYDDSGDTYEVAREITRLFDKADRAQNSLIVALNRKRWLDSQLEKITAPV